MLSYHLMGREIQKRIIYYLLTFTRVLDVIQLMEYQHLLGPQFLAAALPPPQQILGLVLHGIVDLSSRACRAVISSGVPRTLIRPGFARGVGFFSIPQFGEYTQLPDGMWRRAIEHHHPGLRIRVSGIHWGVRAVEADTGPYDLVLGADWLHEHLVCVDFFGRTFSIQAPGGRMILSFTGPFGTLAIVDVLPHPPPSPVAQAAPLEPVIDLDEEPEELDPEMGDAGAGAVPVVGGEPVGNGFVGMGDEGDVTDIEMG